MQVPLPNNNGQYPAPQFMSMPLLPNNNNPDDDIYEDEIYKKYTEAKIRFY
jgi:hypothetical protein